MRIQRITGGLAILALLGAVAGCSSDDEGVPAPTATKGPATSTVPPANTFTPTRTGTPVPPATDTPSVTRTPTQANGTATETATVAVALTPTDTPGPTDVPTPTDTPDLSGPTPTETPLGGGLGLREFSVVRAPVVEPTDPTSSFNTSAIGGFDVSQDPWLPSTFKLLAGQPDENGLASLTLLEDVIVGFFVVDSSVACFKFIASGSNGEVACQAGLGRFVQLSQDSNGDGPPGPLTVTTITEPASVAGSIFLNVTVGFANLPNGQGFEPSDCETAAFMGIGPGVFSSWRGEAEVLNARPIGETLTLAASGRPFDCADWTNPTGPGMIVNPVIGFDQEGLGGGDVANLLVIYGEGTTP